MSSKHGTAHGKTFSFCEKTRLHRRAGGALGHSGQFSGVERQTRVPVALPITFAQGLGSERGKGGKWNAQTQCFSTISRNTLGQVFKGTFKMYV